MILKKIAVLLTCYNRKSNTVDCLTSLYNCFLPEGFSFEVYLVDDGSTDGTAKAINALFPAVKIIQGNGNLFWNRGMRWAWEAARNANNYDGYLWLNDDTYLFESALNTMLTAIKETECRSIIVGTTIATKEKSITYGGFIFPDKLLAPNTTLQECDFFNGNCVFVPETVYAEVGNLDGIFHHALGDIDYGLRASKKGIKSYIVNDTVGYCEAHEANPICFNAAYNLVKRFKHLYSPLGNNPLTFCIFDNRHFGFFSAVKHFFTIHLRVLFPFLWNQK